jgi:hypothetical protein
MCWRPLWALEDVQALKTAFSAASLNIGDYIALGAFDEEIYVLRLQSIPGPAIAFALI